MAKQNQSRFNVAARIGTKTGATPAPAAPPDDILFKSNVSPVDTLPPADQVDDDALLRFGSQLPASDLIALHRISYWQRIPLYEVLSAAIRAYGTTQPEAANPLPEKERASRKLPRA